MRRLLAVFTMLLLSACAGPARQPDPPAGAAKAAVLIKIHNDLQIATEEQWRSKE